MGKRERRAAKVAPAEKNWFEKKPPKESSKKVKQTKESDSKE